MKEDMPMIQRFQVLGIPYSTDKLRLPSSMDRIVPFKPDVIISIHFRDIISAKLIAMAPMGGFNLHPSLLPRYRGCFSGPWAIINLEVQTGISYHYITPEIDGGNLIIQKSFDILPDESGWSLFNKLVDLGVENFLEAFHLVTQERFLGKKQVGIPSYYKRKVPENGVINPQWNLDKIDAFIRALYFPGFKGASVRINGDLIEVKTVQDYLILCGRTY